jgi:hypothetical protein
MSYSHTDQSFVFLYDLKLPRCLSENQSVPVKQNSAWRLNNRERRAEVTPNQELTPLNGWLTRRVEYFESCMFFGRQH